MIKALMIKAYKIVKEIGVNFLKSSFFSLLFIYLFSLYIFEYHLNQSFFSPMVI